MTFISAADLARDLARNAEAVCRYYLPAGKRHGRYWVVGDIHNASGRSTFVRLTGAAFGTGAAGNWQDAATGQFGDLLDLIRLRCGLGTFGAVAEESRRFLGQPHSAPQPSRTIANVPDRLNDGTRPVQAARRLFAGSHAIGDTLAALYLARRGIAVPDHARWLRFHPRGVYRPDPDGPPQAWPTLVAAVTDLSGTIVGVHRTFLARDGRGKAPLPTPRRALGHLHGHAVRFDSGQDVMLVGEGIETVLSVVTVLPTMRAAATLSAGNLVATLFPSMLRRLYVAQDNDTAGRAAAMALAARAREAGIEPISLTPSLGDFNDDLCTIGPAALRSALRAQLAPEDVARFLSAG